MAHCYSVHVLMSTAAGDGCEMVAQFRAELEARPARKSIDPLHISPTFPRIRVRAPCACLTTGRSLARVFANAPRALRGFRDLAALVTLDRIRKGGLQLALQA